MQHADSDDALRPPPSIRRFLLRLPVIQNLHAISSLEEASSGNMAMCLAAFSSRIMKPTLNDR
jgi:hypothetical protein